MTYLTIGIFPERVFSAISTAIDKRQSAAITANQLENILLTAVCGIIILIATSLIKSRSNN
jgi:hypothetical protein